MSDSTEIRGGSDRKRINLSEAYEVNYWTGKLKISREELKQAVDKVGDRAEDVEDFILKGQAPPRRHTPKRTDVQ
ncbi:MAG: DUF3606 domain-containing protein [Myxococcaceae bacterium]|nr:MAG: DUF3606 domain-containing protein [Myxococcaceae bacterium]